MNGGRLRLVLVGILLAILFGAGALVSWYVEALWFASLGYSSIFWKTFEIRIGLFAGFFLATAIILQLAFWALRPRRFDRSYFDRTVIINGRPVTVSFSPVARIVTWVITAVVAFASGLTMASRWTTF